MRTWTVETLEEILPELLDSLHPPVGQHNNEHRMIVARVRAEITYQRGYEDQQAGNGAANANGTYLDGFYSEDNGIPYFLTADDLQILRRL